MQPLELLRCNFSLHINISPARGQISHLPSALSKFLIKFGPWQRTRTYLACSRAHLPVMSWGISFDGCSYLLERNLAQIVVTRSDLESKEL